MVIYSIEFNTLGVRPPIINPRVELLFDIAPCLAVIKLPKSDAFPVEAIVTRSILLLVVLSFGE